MFESHVKMRHLPFFEDLATSEPGERKWQSATAGLVVLRLVDAWLENGTRRLADDEWTMRAVRQTIDEITSSANLGQILHGIIDATQESSHRDLRLLAPRLMAYGQFLEYDAKWSLAADVYDSILAHTHPVHEADIATQAHLRLGFCLRQLGNLTDSTQAYRTAGEIAQNVGDLVGVLRARIGEAKAAVSRGNMPQAGAILDDTIKRAGKEHLTEVRSMALHDRAAVAHLSGEYELAVRLAYEALETTHAPRERDRILGDIAGMFHTLGVRTAARDAYLILAATAQEQYGRWAATLNLMELAIDDGEQLLFEQYHRSFDPAEMPVQLRVSFWHVAGLGFGRFGQNEKAQRFLERAIAVAEENELNQFAFEARAALTALGQPRRLEEPQRAHAFLNEAVREIVRHIGAQREKLGV